MKFEAEPATVFRHELVVAKKRVDQEFRTSCAGQFAFGDFRTSSQGAAHRLGVGEAEPTNEVARGAGACGHCSGLRLVPEGLEEGPGRAVGPDGNPREFEVDQRTRATIAVAPTPANQTRLFRLPIELIRCGRRTPGCAAPSGGTPGGRRDVLRASGAREGDAEAGCVLVPDVALDTIAFAGDGTLDRRFGRGGRLRVSLDGWNLAESVATLGRRGWSQAAWAGMADPGC
jgi:hypothetical protein